MLLFRNKYGNRYVELHLCEYEVKAVKCGCCGTGEHLADAKYCGYCGTELEKENAATGGVLSSNFLDSVIKKHTLAD